MSVRISALKKSKILAYQKLKELYPNSSFKLYYNIGNRDKDYKDQHLNIKTDLDRSHHSNIKDIVASHLESNDTHYIGLQLRVEILK